MLSLGIEPRAARWQAHTDPLSYGDSRDDFIRYFVVKEYTEVGITKIYQYQEIWAKEKQTTCERILTWLLPNLSISEFSSLYLIWEQCYKT